MNPSVYIETSIVSYLTARPGRDVVIAAHQHVTRRWWRGRGFYSLFVSQIVLDEAAVGDPTARSRRLRALRGVPFSPSLTRGRSLRGNSSGEAALPKKATVDAFHIGIAAAHQVDYLLTWNCKHIANATMRGPIETICRAAGLTPPTICTPEELPAGSST